MQFYDFEYDGISLSDLGYMVCSFDGKGLETVSNGSKLNFNTVRVHNGEKYELSNVEYDEYIELTFQICKHPCKANNDWEITMKEFNDLMRWLNRKQFNIFRIKEDNYIDIYFEASFNISRIEINGKLYGLELNMITNRPYALRNERTNIYNITTSNGKFIIHNKSDDEGIIYPKMKIIVNQSGNLDIYNAFENRHTHIANCTQGEIITMNYPIIQSSLSSHKIQNDFNWNFFRLANTFREKKNEVTVSIPCSIELSYNPIVKVVV